MKGNDFMEDIKNLKLRVIAANAVCYMLEDLINNKGMNKAEAIEYINEYLGTTTDELLDIEAISEDDIEEPSDADPDSE